MTRCLPGLIIFLTIQPASPADDRVFALRSLAVNDGLSQNHVTAFAQDRLGFAWIGTGVGLNRYDGHEFKIYTHSPEEKASILSDAIYALHCDRQGRIWVGTDRGIDLYDPPTDSFRHFLTGPLMAGGPGQLVRAIGSDNRGFVWASVRAKKSPGYSAVARLDPASGRIEEFDVDDSGADILFIHPLDDRRVVVVLYRRSGLGFTLVVLDPQSRAVTPLPDPPGAETPPFNVSERDISFAPAGPDSCWIGARGSKIFRADLRSSSITAFSYDQGLRDTSLGGLVSHVVAGNEGDVWVIPTWDRPNGATSDSAIYRLPAGQFPSRKNSLSTAGVCDFTRSFVISSQIDRSGVLWAGLSGSGFCLADLESGMFSRIHESSPGARLSNNFVRSVWKSPDGTLWVGTRVGIDRIDRRRMVTQSIQSRPGVRGSLSDHEVTALLLTRDNTLWVGTQKGGLNRDPGQRGFFEHFKNIPGDPRSLSDNHVNTLMEDREGTLWIATGGGGLNRFHPADRSFSTYRHRPEDPSSISSGDVTSLFEDSLGRMWAGTRNAGLNLFDRKTGRFTPVSLDLSEPPNIVSVAEDPTAAGVLWIATLRHGLIRCDPAAKPLSHFTTRNSLLPSDTVFLVQPDHQGSVWAGTNRGLVRISGKPASFRIFGIDQGLQSMEFNSRASFQAADGELLLGGVGGLNTFYPRDITQNTFPANVVITLVRTINRSQQSTSSPYSTLFRLGSAIPSSSLDPAHRELIFTFAGLHFADPARTAYRYKLDGFDESWRDAGPAREAVYTNLSPGSYTFRVKAVTSRGVWSLSDATYSFTIAKPFYLTTWFVVLCLAAGLSLAYSAYRFRIHQLRAAERALQSQVDLRTSELSTALNVVASQAEQLKETDEMKSRFLTNISHDFRTPLSVTLGTLTDLRSGHYGALTPAASQELETAIRNERRLLRLVNQLLAIARLESGKLRLHVSSCDLSSLASEVVSAFLPVARQRDIALDFTPDAEPVPVTCDAEWIEQVVTNLLLNALKFTPPGGRVAVATGHDRELNRLFLSVQDSGPGIATADLPRIFDRFYQTQHGAATPHAGIGVGLSLAREIVELHRGEIQVRSQLDSGSIFTILLQPGHAHFDPAHMAAGAAPHTTAAGLALLADDLLVEHDLQSAPAGDAADKPTIVIAEDDPELLAFLCKHLQGPYRVLPSGSGTEALALITSEIPDLVLSDVMMPGIDGYELCRLIRSNPETDFIPVILLTARAEHEQKLEGLHCGADDYLTKPFETSELKIRIQNCVQARARLKSRMASFIAFDSTKAFDPLPDSADALFLRRVYDAIRENAHDETFSVEQLANELALSRMHLYRRLRELTQKAPAELLMDYRLERAAQLLAAKTGSVSEVAYAAGFKSVSHFTRRFREKYQCVPSAYSTAPSSSAPPTQTPRLQ